MASNAEEWRLSELNREVAQLETETSQLQAEAAEQARAADRAERRLRKLRFAQQLRGPAKNFALWRTGVMAIGPIVTGILAALIGDVFISSSGVLALVFLLGAAAGAALLYSLLFHPSDDALPREIVAATASSKLLDSQRGELNERLTTALARQQALIEERRELVASGKVQRAALLQREWKVMADAEWEDFVVEVCRTLGAKVERVPKTTAKDATLVVRFDDRSVAVVTSGEGRTVNSTAIQQAIAGQKRQACDRCAVVLNRRVTGAAQDFARHNSCTVVSLDEFPDLVLGKIEL